MTAADATRTCVGCRERASRSDLLRVVAAEVDGVRTVVPDPRRRLPGRGAWLHHDPGCLDLAERRRAFGRALRSPTVLALAGVREALEQEQKKEPPRDDRPNGSGFDADEPSMSAKR